MKEEELIGVIGSSGADLVALQQCSEERCGRISTACGYEYVGNWAEPERGDGVALLSKMPLGQHDGKTSIPIGSYSYWDEVKPIRRAFVLAAYVSRFQLPLLVTQLERWSDQSDDEKKRQEKQVESLLKPDSSMEWLKSKQRIIVGDLDVEPSSPLIAKLRSDGELQEAFEGHSEATYPAQAPVKKVDYVFYHPELCRVVSSRVIREPICCDHLPLLVEFERPKVGIIVV